MSAASCLAERNGTSSIARNLLSGSAPAHCRKFVAISQPQRPCSPRPQCGSLRLGSSTAATRPALTRAAARPTSPCCPPSGLRPASLVTWPGLRGRLPEAPVPHELVHEAWVGRVAAAGVGHHEDTGTRNPLRLRPGPAARGATEELSVGGDPHERHHRLPTVLRSLLEQRARGEAGAGVGC